MLRDPIITGDYKISIQASGFHYCTPRKDLPELDDYSAVEIAIFDSADEWVQPREDEFIQQFHKFDELIACYEDGDVAVGAYIPMDLVQEFIQYLKEQ